ncbi:MAG: succinate dehydrogenase/fumarate reductase transmembrane subunit [Fimbriimonadaceae bacterium]
MALHLTRENYFWHKLHSLTGVVPVGYYMVQHLVLNSFSLAGPDKFNGVIDFFDSLPKGLLLFIELTMIWLPLAFHAMYGIFIVERARLNYFDTPYKWSQNRMFTLQRISGLFLFVFLIYHSLENTGAKYYRGDSNIVKFDAWHTQLTSYHYAWLVFYMVGVLAASYHLCYGLWNFCIRWGITISEPAQARIQRFSLGSFVALTLLGWGALAGFLREPPSTPSEEALRTTQVPNAATS